MVVLKFLHLIRLRILDVKSKFEKINKKSAFYETAFFDFSIAIFK